MRSACTATPSCSATASKATRRVLCCAGHEVRAMHSRPQARLQQEEAPTCSSSNSSGSGSADRTWAQQQWARLSAPTARQAAAASARAAAVAAASTGAGLLQAGLARAAEPLAGALDPAIAAGGDAAAQEAAQKVAEALAAGTYVPSDLGAPGWEIWAGFVAGVVPFAIGSWEFGKRIIIQQRCQVCSGRGLVPSNREGARYLRKCPQCGGFFPWVSWKLFLTSTAAPGNGGPLQFPKGQTGVFYDVDKFPTGERPVREAQAEGAAASEPSPAAAESAKVTNIATEKL